MEKMLHHEQNGTGETAQKTTPEQGSPTACKPRFLKLPPFPAQEATKQFASHPLNYQQHFTQIDQAKSSLADLTAQPPRFSFGVFQDHVFRERDRQLSSAGTSGRHRTLSEAETKEKVC